MKQRFAVRGLVGILFLVGIDGVAQDSQVTTTPPGIELQQSVRPNDTLIVTGKDGNQIRGRLAGLSADTVLLRDAGTERRIPVGQIAEIERYTNGVWLGMIIGGGVGAPLFILAIVNSQKVEAREYAVPFLSLAAGIGIDAAIGSRRTIYRRDPATQLSLRPFFKSTKRGVALSVRF